mmetsp:Transcript_17102/g.26640  ORF Transcript_17102/g.26640 Transcript_17102/m.26640 type:complete len:96 (-) Transcript_17102:401-688(-)
MASKALQIPTKIEVLHLFRGIIKYGKMIKDYNFREYALRRTRDGFRSNQSLQGEELSKVYSNGLNQFEIVRRQALIGQLYPSETSVMESIGRKSL